MNYTRKNNVTFIGYLLPWHIINASIIQGNKHLLKTLSISSALCYHQIQKKYMQDTVSDSKGTYYAVKKLHNCEMKAITTRCSSGRVN